ncbi:LysR family transcriptional regulator [Nitratireductor aquimarinus]|uniref:LysR family transcriptional regulator n=1 Tax=Nitratireductor aquimarinus TaxID=889300 RepID=A0ABU4AGP8_9HYPH|nr:MULTISPECIES: LysR family transcriptional regulator [Alphaproteobacteria]MBY6021648.1 LysR family transcriptional regulator [Nitratireductor sp. DP7N14-4]MBN7756761.1 LysR family transcriptional regulator [Nitratireductor aquimarinus]MBN7761942.1 LysR family transcriptional regulator [Nitratireductor aquibiodomus]MBN7775206.1 LysR family transcriptional regulator [Nitratireductor pacificus]MBN7781220.1 LysR family transcriptional regulator [Nitratireductor pacificus]
MDTLSRMRAFVDVVEAEGFSAAARKVGKSKALLSKYVRELEDELGALLLNRTTRQLSLTEAGHTYYARAVELLRDVEDLAESVRDSSGDVRGRVRLSAPRTFADAPVGQSLIDFAKAHPDITLEINLDDRFVDLVEEGFDLAIRITKLSDSSLIAKRLAPFRVVLCASPELIATHGEPKSPQDLTHLPCIVDTNSRYRQNWPFRDEDGEIVNIPVTGRIEVNSPMTARAAAISGLGFAVLPDFIADPEVEAGRLVPLLQDNAANGAGIYAIYPHRRYLPAKVRAFVDYLARWLKENYPTR